jgi:hypothetical protein
MKPGKWSSFHVGGDAVGYRLAGPWNAFRLAGVKVGTMMRVKWRWVLPLGHALIDCILLIALIAYSHRVYRGETRDIPAPTPIRPALFLQESGSVDWDPRTSNPPGPVLLITTGDFPAGLLAGVLRPNAGDVGRRQPWDPIWFLLHEAFSFPCWYFIGAWIDAGRVRLGKFMIAYAAVRLVLALAGFYEVGWRIQILFWMGLAFWLAGLGLSRLIRVGLRAAKRV